MIVIGNCQAICRKNMISKVLSVMGIILSAVILWTSFVYINDAFYFLSAVLIAGSVLLWERGIPGIGKDRRAFVFACLLSLLFLFILSFRLIEARVILYSLTGRLPANWVSGVFKGILAVICFLSVYTIVSTVFSWEIRADLHQNPDIRAARHRAFAVIALVSLVFLFSNYEGWSYPDYLNVWKNVHTGSYSEWHTVGYMLFVKAATLIWDSMFMVSILQTAVWLIVNDRALRILEKKNSRQAIRYYTIISLILYIPFVYLQAMVKDTIFSICLFGMGVAIYPLIEQEETKKTDWLFLFLFSMGTALFRHGGIVVVVLSLTVLLLIRRKYGVRNNLPGMITTGAVILGYVLIVVVIGRLWLNAYPNPKYVKYSIPFYMAGELVADEDVMIDEEDLSFLESFADIDEWKENHDKYWADPVAREYGILGDAILYRDESTYGIQLIQFNLKYLLRYPVKYLEHYGNITSILWQIARPADGYERGPIEGMATDYEQGIASTQTNGFTVMTRTISDFTGKLPVLRSVIWRGGFIQFCYLVCFFCLILRKKLRYFIVALPVVFFYASLYLSIPGQDPRYVLGALELFPFFLMVVFTAKGTDHCNLNNGTEA